MPSLASVATYRLPTFVYAMPRPEVDHAITVSSPSSRPRCSWSDAPGASSHASSTTLIAKESVSGSSGRRPPNRSTTSSWLVIHPLCTTTHRSDSIGWLFFVSRIDPWVARRVWPKTAEACCGALRNAAAMPSSRSSVAMPVAAFAVAISPGRTITSPDSVATATLAAACDVVEAVEIRARQRTTAGRDDADQSAHLRNLLSPGTAPLRARSPSSP